MLHSGDIVDVLLVEDDELVRDCLTEALHAAGVGIAGSASGEAALAALTEHAWPDVIVTDINLGRGMDGLAFARAARKMNPDLPVVYISGRYGELRGLLPIERFLPKPFTTPTLLRLIDEVVAAVPGQASAE
jgi:CheY-like chemotaxis protein